MKTRERQFTVIYEQAEEGGFIARVPALPGCMTQGENFEETQKMAREAIKAYCASLKKHKEPIPSEGHEVVGTIRISA